MPYLAKIFIYPIKSLDGVEVQQSAISVGGALAHDREFAIVDAQGKFVNGKRTPKIHQIRSAFDLNQRTVTVQIPEQPPQTFHLDDDRSALASWLSNYFSYPVSLQQNQAQGFPDDIEASGPTVVSTATLETIARWFPALTLDQIRQRFRTNLEVAAAPAFWEDQLFGTVDEQMPFQIGTVQFWGCNPCQRCIVPTRDPQTGNSYPNFQKTFVAQRQATLPAQVERSRFNHFYRLTLNTKIPASEAGKMLAIDDQVRLT
ncbi:MAG: MOSC domain-containing protein [Elainellaceae cyanobacterium]